MSAGSALDDQARRNAEVRAAVVREFGVVGVGELGDRVGSHDAHSGDVVGDWLQTHRLITVRWQGLDVVPRFLLLDDGRPDPLACAALKVLAEQGFSGWQAAVWWVVPQQLLAGRRPVDVLLEVRRFPAERRAIVEAELRAAAWRPRDWF